MSLMAPARAAASQDSPPSGLPVFSPTLLLLLSLVLVLTIVDQVVRAVLEGETCSPGRDTGPTNEQGTHKVHVPVHDSDMQGSLTWTERAGS